jgi:hypothetical protein
MTQAAQLAQYGANNVGLSFKNRIINGDMTIDQRNAGASVTANSEQFVVDRWKYEVSQSSKGTSQQNQGSVTPPAGFSNYVGFTSSSAYSVLSSDYFWFTQWLEGFNTSDLNFGTANAQTITLSFWVRSSLTGTFGGSLTNNNISRCFPFSYTINAANTWEQKSIIVVGDTSGTWAGATNGNSIRLMFSLGTGSTRVGGTSVWSSSDFRGGLAGSQSVVGTNGATWYVTGVQLEKGSVATSFDYLPYGTELQLCQRYYELSYPAGFPPGYNFGQQYPFSTSKPVAVNLIASDDTVVSQSVRFVVNKRVSPTVTIYSADNGASGFAFTYKGTGGTAINVSASVIYTSENLWNIGQSLGAVNQANESYFHFAASAEL